MRSLLALALAAGSFGCAAPEPRVQGGELTVEDGPFAGSLEPAPFDVGLNRAELRLRAADGAPLEGAEVRISPWMPAHGHGTETVDAEAVEPSGAYVTERLRFQMGGRWELRVHVVYEGEEGDLVATLEVP